MSTARKTPFELRGADSGPLRGEVRTSAGGSGRPAVIVCHGFKGFKDWGFFPHLADRLARAGMTVVTFNFSGSGVGTDGLSFSEPERFYRCTFSNDLEDIATVAAALSSGRLIDELEPIPSYGLLGHSRGGGTAILYSAADPDVKALVTWAAIARPARWSDEEVRHWRARGEMEVVNARTGEGLTLGLDLLEDIEARGAELDVLAAAYRLCVPWLIVHGADDESVPVAEAKALYRAASADDARLLLVRQGGHTFGAQHPWAGSTPQLDIAMDATVNWFVDSLY